MKYLGWLLKAALFFTVFAFALNNQSSVTVQLFFGHAFEAPLVVTLFITLVCGVVVGVLVMVPMWLRAKKAAIKPAEPPLNAQVPSATPHDWHSLRVGWHRA